MQNKDELFVLIKSLSGNEKRYFKLYSNLQKGDKTYLQLFEAIDKIKTYDEARFKTKNSKSSFIENFTWRKHHLQQMILDSLELFHKTTESEIYSLLHRSQILFNKSLINAGKKTLARAKQTARKHELHVLLYEVLRIEESVASKTFDFKAQLQCVADMNDTLAVIRNQHEYKTVFTRLYQQHLSIGVFRSKADELIAQKIAGKIISAPDANAKSITARRQLFYMRFIYFFMKGNLQKQYENSKKNVTTYTESPEQIELNTAGYITALNAFLYCCTRLKKTEELKSYIDYFNSKKTSFKNKTNHAGAIVILNHEITYYNLIKKYERGLQVNDLLIGEIEKHKDSIAELEMAGYCVNIAMNYFLNKKYKEALLWLNKTLNEHRLDVRWDMESMVNIFYIITHFEKGASRDFLKLLVKKTYRILLRRKTLHRFEALILDFIRAKLSKVKDEDNMTEPFVSLRKKLTQLKKDPMESRPLEYFDLIAWLTSKIDGTDFREAAIG